MIDGKLLGIEVLVGGRGVEVVILQIVLVFDNERWT